MLVLRRLIEWIARRFARDEVDYEEVLEHRRDEEAELATKYGRPPRP